MKTYYEVESRANYRLDPEWSSSQIAKFTTFGRARAYALKLSIGGWIDAKRGGKKVSTVAISLQKARRHRRRFKRRSA